MPQLPPENDLPAPPAESDLAPRPRPGFRSQPASFEAVRLFAGSLRAVLGAAGLFASLQYLPIQMATPVLAGVSILMMITGVASVFRAVADAPHLKVLPRVVAALCALVTLVTVGLTLVIGAGALGPLKDLPRRTGDDGSVRFEMQP